MAKLLNEYNKRSKMIDHEPYQMHFTPSKMILDGVLKNGKSSVKLYIPQRYIEKFQAFCIYLQLSGYVGDSRRSSFSSWVMAQMIKIIDNLVSSENEDFKQAVKILKDLKTNKFSQDEDFYKKFHQL